MNFTSFFIKNPVYAIVFNVMLLVIGILSFNSLRVREYPYVEVPQIRVWTGYQNASPEVIESAVTIPLEDELAGVEGVEFIRSYSSYENSSIDLQFREGMSMDKAVAAVRDAIGRVRGRLPKDVREPSIYRDNGKQGQDDTLIVLAAKSEKMNSLELRHFIDTSVKNAFRSIDGVSAVDVYGDCYLARIRFDPKKLHLFGINADDIYDAIDSESVLRPIGKIQNTISASMKSKIETKDDFQQIILRSHDSKLLKNPKRSVAFLKDIADIDFSVDDRSSRCFLNGRKGTFIAIKAASDANPVDVSNSVLKKVKNLKNEITSDIKISVLCDNTDFIRAAIKNAEEATIEAVILVLMIVFLFLRSFRATLVPIITIPISLIGAIVFLKMFGFSINIMTLMAMVLAVGLVVDDAIVVLEDISRHIEEGMSKTEAAIKGASEISWAIVAMTLTLVSVYAPLIFMEGTIGQLFIEFAVALAGSVLISGFIALTLSPLMCSVLLRSQKKADRFLPWFDGAFSDFSKRYAKFLEQMMNRKKMIFCIALGSFLLSLSFVYIVPKETAPGEDRGEIGVWISQIAGKNMNFYEVQLKKVQKYLDNVPEVLHSLAFANPDNGYMSIILKPKNERSRTANEIAEDLQEKMYDFPSLDVNIWSVEAQLPGVSNGYGNSYVSVIVSTSDSYQDLYDNLEKARAKFLKDPMFRNPQNRLLMNNRVYKIHIDNDKVAKLGLSKEKIARTLEMFFSGNRNLHFEKDGIEYPISIETTKKCSNLSEIYVTNDQGKRISLDVVARMIPSTEPPEFFHYNQMRSAYFGFGVAEGEDFEKVLNAGMKILNETLPFSYKKTVQGIAEQTEKSQRTMLMFFALAIIFIFAILSLQFNNFRDPLIILLTVPLACSGALFGIWLLNISLNIYTSVGLVTLIGLITKHGIMIVEFANQLIKEGKSVTDAMHTAAVLRLRPILITTGAMFLGSIPLVLSQDYGCESRQAIGVILTCGLFFGTIFVLTIFPIVCSKLKEKSSKK